MDNSAENLLWESLQSNRKNFNDLIGQELSMWVLATQIAENESFIEISDYIFQKIYLKTSQTIQHILEEWLINQTEKKLSDQELQIIKQQIQLFTQDLVNEKKADLSEMVYQIKKRLNN
jgi:hypothetical protein